MIYIRKQNSVGSSPAAYFPCLKIVHRTPSLAQLVEHHAVDTVSKSMSIVKIIFNLLLNY